MSIKSVRAEIVRSMKNNFSGEKALSRLEALRIVAEARKGPVTPGEVKAVRDLSSKGVDPSAIVTEAIPELRGDAFYMTPGTKSVLDNFVVANTPGGGGRMVTLAIPENPSDGAISVTLAIPENPSDGAISVTLAIPENPSDGARFVTMAIPENPSDGGRFVTMAIPENSNDARAF